MPDEKESGLLTRVVAPLFDRMGFVQKAQVEKAKAIALQEKPYYGNGFSGNMSSKMGLPKPSKVSFAQLRMIAKYDYLTRICINSIKKSVSQAEWDIVPRKGYAKNQAHIDEVYKLFMLVNSNGENLRVILDRTIEDLLTLDAGVIEKVFDVNGKLIEFNSVDGATVRPRMDEHGSFEKDYAYAQVVNNEIAAEFKLNEIIYMMQNPQSDIESYGYGMSPIESIMLAVQASLNADMYNSQVFSEDNIPPGILDLGDMTDAEAQQFIARWEATVIGHTQKMKFIWGDSEGKKFIPFKNSQKDMQFVEYLDWLSRVKLAAFGLSALDANILQDVNRSTADVQRQISRSRGVRTTMRLYEEYFDREIILASGYEDVVFRFIKEDDVTDRKTQAEIDKIYVEAGIQNPTEVAEREGFKEFDMSQDTEVDEPADGMGDNPNPTDAGIEGDQPANTDALKSKKGTHFPPLY